MKFIEIFMVVVSINIAFTMMSANNILPRTVGMNESDQLAFTSTRDELITTFDYNRSTLGSEVVDATKEATYSKTFGTDQFSDVDFLTGLWIIAEIFVKGIFYVGPTLTAFGVPKQLHFMILIPVYIVYLLAFFQVVSGRNVEANK